MYGEVVVGVLYVLIVSVFVDQERAKDSSLDGVQRGLALHALVKGFASWLVVGRALEAFLPRDVVRCRIWQATLLENTKKDEAVVSGVFRRNEDPAVGKPAGLLAVEVEHGNGGPIMGHRAENGDPDRPGTEGLVAILGQSIYDVDSLVVAVRTRFLVELTAIESGQGLVTQVPNGATC